MDERIKVLEHINQVKETKPKIFQLIQNEFADGKEQLLAV